MNVHKANMATINHKIKQLRAEVYGHSAEIAAEAGVSTVTVSKVLNGHYVNQDVIAAAIKVRDRIKAEKAAQLEKLAAKI